MEKQETQITTRPKRLILTNAPLKPYRLPRYWVTLVCEAAGTPSPTLIQTSTAAAALLRPCFDGLDREQFLEAVRAIPITAVPHAMTSAASIDPN